MPFLTNPPQYVPNLLKTIYVGGNDFGDIFAGSSEAILHLIEMGYVTLAIDEATHEIAREFDKAFEKAHGHSFQTLHGKEFIYSHNVWQEHPSAVDNTIKHLCIGNF